MVLLLFNNKENKWNVITLDQKKELPKEEASRVLYLDGELKRRLDFAKEQIKLNNDSIGLIFGAEGSGKSSIGGNIMRYMTDDKFDPKKQMIGSDYEDALNKLEAVESNGALMFDEGNAFFLATETMTKEHRDLHKIFSIFRQKNLFVLIVLPSFFRLGSYFALDRAKFGVRTYLNNGKRGYFAYYGEKRKAQLYKLGKKEHDYMVSPPNFRGRFTKCEVLESKEYKDFKLKTLREAFNRAKEVKKTPKEIEREARNRIILNNPDMSNKELGRILNLTEEMIRQIRKKHEKLDVSNQNIQENDTPHQNPEILGQ